MHRTMTLLTALALAAGCGKLAAGDAATRECWVWQRNRLTNDGDYAKATNIVARAAKAGYNAMVLSAGEDTYWQAERRERVRRLDGYMKSLGMELIPCIWSMGYGGTVTYVDADTIESTPNRGLRFKVNGTAAKFVPDTVETGFEGRTLTNSLSLKLTGKVKPYRTYVFKCRCRTEKIDPVKYYAVRGNIYHGVKKEQELYDFPVTATQDWKWYYWEFNTYSTDELTLAVYINRSHMTSGTCWFDSLSVEERPFTRCHTTEDGMKPVVRSAATGRTYVAGKDYRPFPKTKSVHDAKPIAVELLPGSAISDGEELLVDCHVPAIEGAKQFSVCPSASALKAYRRKTARDIDTLFHPRRWFFTVDEWRVANRCDKCRARQVSPGQLMGESVAEMAAIVREVNPQAEVCAWADMFCPLENAGRNPYYCVDGSIVDSWKYVPKDLIMVPWMNGRKDVESTNWLMEHGFRCIAGGYYNYPDLSRDITWRDGCKGNPKFLGMMFTTWGGSWGDGGYDKLEEYARMVHER